MISLKKLGASCAAALLALSLSACSGSAGEAKQSDAAGQSSAAAEPEKPAEPTTSAEWATLIGGGAPTIEITEDNDGNDLIGRPNGYSEATVVQLEGLDASGCDTAEPGVDCGLTIEKWGSAADAKKRGEYIQSIYKEMSGLGSEYDYVKGDFILRISGEVNPSQAEELNAKFGGEVVTAPAAG